MTIVVFGNATLDVTYRMSELPRAGETVLAKETMREAGGKGFNQAVSAHLTGAPTTLIAAVGEDSAGDVLIRAAEAFGLPTQHIHRRSLASDQSIIAVSDDGDNLIISTCGCAASLGAADLPNLAETDILLVQGNLRKASTKSALEDARRVGATAVANASPLSFDWADLIPLCDILVVNREEAAILTGQDDPLVGVKQFREIGVSTPIITLGGEGALALVDGEALRVQAVKVNKVDTTGAGDCFTGALTGLLQQHQPLDRSLRTASKIASLSVEMSGASASFLSADIIQRCIAEQFDIGSEV